MYLQPIPASVNRILPAMHSTASFTIRQANIGLRYEHVDFDYFENATFVPGQSRVYDNIFPNISVNGQLGKVQFQVSYAAKTQRPNYSQLRNNITYANRFTWQTGNPLLKPSVTHDITAVGVWRFFQAMVSYKVVRDYILYWGTQVENQSATTLINYITAIFAKLTAKYKKTGYRTMFYANYS